MKKRLLSILFVLVLVGCAHAKNSTTTSPTTTTTNTSNQTLTPVLTNASDNVFQYQNLTITNNNLYEMMKQNTGSTSLVNLIDRNLLSNYENQIDQTALQDEIDNTKTAQDQQGTGQFYKNMVMQGVINSVDDSDRDTKIENFYLLLYLQKAYAKEQAINALNQNEIQEKVNNYQKDMCVITLKYNNKSAADDAQSRLAAATDKEQFFKNEFANQNNETTVTTDQHPFFNSDFTCHYNLAEYYNYDSRIKFRDFLYNSTDMQTYTTTPKFIADENAFYMVYRLAKPDYKSNYKQSQAFINYINDQLTKNTMTNTYVKNEITALHNRINLKIYDTEIGKQYKNNYDSSFLTETKLLDNYTVATYINPTTNKIVKITTNQLYNDMKLKYAVPILLNKINYEVLKQVPGIQLSNKEKQSIVDQIKQYKDSYNQQQHQQYTWNQFMELNFGAVSDDELATILAGPTLVNRYMLGYHVNGNDYTGAAELTDAQKEQGYNDYFELSASHILLTYDPNNQDSIDKAKEEANQIINGCTDNGVLTVDTCYIFYNPNDSTDTTTPFKGLDETRGADLESTFYALAQAFSDDPTNTNNGNLGPFTPGVTISSLEEALKVIYDGISQGGVPYSLTPIQDESYHGYHVILVTDSAEKPVKPDNYEEVKAAIDAGNASDTYTDAQISAVNNYDDYMIGTITPFVQAKLTTRDNENKLLAQLRDQMSIKFIDNDIQKIYLNVQKMQEDYNMD